jgi:diguanylate cyclase (GGDEF)-like protein
MMFFRAQFLEDFFKSRIKQSIDSINSKWEKYFDILTVKASFEGDSFEGQFLDMTPESCLISFPIEFVFKEMFFEINLNLKQMDLEGAQKIIETEVENHILRLDTKFLEKYVYQDDLTQVFNYRRLYVDIEDSIRKAKLTGKNFCLVFIDIDNFKKINDHYGHFVGSSLLQKLSDAFNERCKQLFTIYRYGGDEFVFLCSDISLDVLSSELEKLTDGIFQNKFELENGQSYQMSLSVGFAEYPTHGKNFKEMIEIADKMMYECKKVKSKKVVNLKKNG